MSLQTSVPWRGHGWSLHAEPRSAGGTWSAEAALVLPCPCQLVYGEGQPWRGPPSERCSPLMGLLCADSNSVLFKPMTGTGQR